MLFAELAPTRVGVDEALRLAIPEDFREFDGGEDEHLVLYRMSHVSPGRSPCGATFLLCRCWRRAVFPSLLCCVWSEVAQAF